VYTPRYIVRTRTTGTGNNVDLKDVGVGDVRQGLHQLIVGGETHTVALRVCQQKIDVYVLNQRYRRIIFIYS